MLSICNTTQKICVENNILTQTFKPLGGIPRNSIAIKGSSRWLSSHGRRGNRIDFLIPTAGLSWEEQKVEKVHERCAKKTRILTRLTRQKAILFRRHVRSSEQKLGYFFSFLVDNRNILFTTRELSFVPGLHSHPRSSCQQTQLICVLNSFQLCPRGIRIFGGITRRCQGTQISKHHLLIVRNKSSSSALFNSTLICLQISLLVALRFRAHTVHSCSDTADDLKMIPPKHS